MSETIFTLNARDNILLDLLSSYGADTKRIYDIINTEFQECLLDLSNQGLDYKNLKNGLTPSTHKNEIAYVFDKAKTNIFSYGYEVFSKLIPLFDHQSCNSILLGDFIGDNNKERLKSLFFKEITSVKPITHIANNQFFIIYLNNLSESLYRKIDYELNNYDPYVGYFHLTYSSLIKTYLSLILINAFIKNKNTIIIGEFDNYKEVLEKNGFLIKKIPSHYFDLFLSYKIEREVFPGYQNDPVFSLYALSSNILNISNLQILIEPSKYQYLLKEKAGT